MSQDGKSKSAKNKIENASGVLHFRRHGLTSDPNEKRAQMYYQQEKERSALGNPAEHVRELAEKIDGIELQDEFENDQNQQELLEKKKNRTKGLILDTLNQAGKYMEITARLGALIASKDEYQTHDYQKRFEELDRLKRLSHEALISNINIANRFISKNFGEVEKEIIECWEEEESNAGRPTLHAKRINLPRNVICPDQIDLSNRDRIADWAEQIVSRLSELKNEL